MAFPQASDYRPPIIPDGQEYDNPDNGKSYYWTQILLPEGSTVLTATTIGGYWTVVCDEEAKFLLRRGDDVDDCTQPVTYSWNEDVSLLAQNNLTLSSNQGNLTANAQDRVYISSTLGGAIEANNNELLSWDALDVKLTKTISDTDISKVVVNKEYVDARDELLRQDIIELEEEIDAIAPSVQRGSWEVDQSVTQGDAAVGLGKFYLVKTAGAGFDVTTNYTEADGIVLSNTDVESDTHTWVDVKDEQLIQMFDKSDSDFVLGEITNTTPTYSGNNNVLIEFNRIQAQGSPVNSPDTQGRYLARLNIFEAPTGGDASGFVLKTGDTMSGNLEMSGGKGIKFTGLQNSNIATDTAIELSRNIGEFPALLTLNNAPNTAGSPTLGGYDIKIFGNTSYNELRIMGGSSANDPSVAIKANGFTTIYKDVTINSLTVGRGRGSVDTNTAVGVSALSSNTTGSSNTAVGRSALLNNTTGTDNTAVGYGALYNNNTSTENTALGAYALNKNTTGDYNTAVGRNAGYYIEGDNNTILGAYTGTTGDASLNNTVIISAGPTQRMRIKSDGNTEFYGKVTSTSTEASDPGTTLVTKEYVDGFVKKEGGDSMEGPLQVTGQRNVTDGLESTVKVLNVDSGQNSSLHLKHDGETRVYVGDEQTSFQGHIKFNVSGRQIYSGADDNKKGLAFYNNGVQYVGDYTDDKHVATKKDVDAAAGPTVSLNCGGGAKWRKGTLGTSTLDRYRYFGIEVKENTASAAIGNGNVLYLNKLVDSEGVLQDMRNYTPTDDSYCEVWYGNELYFKGQLKPSTYKVADRNVDHIVCDFSTENPLVAKSGNWSTSLTYHLILTGMKYTG